jgi:hypothetical protein
MTNPNDQEREALGDREEMLDRLKQADAAWLRMEGVKDEDAPLFYEGFEAGVKAALAAREDTERPEEPYDDEYALRDEEGDFRCFGSRRDLEACLLEGETLMMRKVSDWNFVVQDTEQEPEG